MVEVARWTLLGERPGPVGYLKVVTRTYAMPDGRVVEWDVLQTGRSVAVVALNTDGQVVLVRQYRPGPDRILVELPGGHVEPGEDILTAAARELHEETGYVPERVTVVGRTWLTAYSQNERYAVLATGCRYVGGSTPDPGEHCETVLMGQRELLLHVRSGELTDTDIAFMCLDYLSTMD